LAAPSPETWRCVQTALHRREPRRGERRHRYGFRRQSGTRRLHAARNGERPDHGESGPLRQGPLRPGQGLRAGRAVRRISVCTGDLAGSPIRSIADLVAAARAKPGAVSYGSTGFGGGNHLAGELLALATHTQLTHVPTRAARPRSPTCSAASSRSCSTPSSPRFRKSAPESCVRSRCRARNAPRLFRSAEHAGGGHRGLRYLAVARRARARRNSAGIVNRLNAEILKALNAPECRSAWSRKGATRSSSEPPKTSPR